MKFSEEQIGNIDGGKTALVLCGYGPFGDCQSIRHRLDAARAQKKKLEEILPDSIRIFGPKDQYVVEWKRELKIWKYAIVEGEKLLKRELKKWCHINDIVFSAV